MTRALLVRGGFVYTADDHDTVHPTGSILAVDGRITAVGDVTAAQLPRDIANSVTTLDAGGMMVLPGFVNNHWHEMFALRMAFRGARRPAHDRDDEPGFMAHGGNIPAISAAFDSFAGLADGLTDAEADAIARYSLWTQLRSGTTTVGQHVGERCGLPARRAPLPAHPRRRHRTRGDRRPGAPPRVPA
jgi:imidazolonepropionase-like amidohydrolase